jgi:hypothetical protein
MLGFVENLVGIRTQAVLWIRIHLDLAVLDPDPYWECVPGSGSRSKEIDQNLQINLVFCLSKMLFYLRLYIFDLVTA